MKRFGVNRKAVLQRCCPNSLKVGEDMLYRGIVAGVEITAMDWSFDGVSQFLRV